MNQFCLQNSLMQNPVLSLILDTIGVGRFYHFTLQFILSQSDKIKAYLLTISRELEKNE